jgi:hypothetical protein
MPKKNAVSHSIISETKNDRVEIVSFCAAVISEIAQLGSVTISNSSENCDYTLVDQDDKS